MGILDISSQESNQKPAICQEHFSRLAVNEDLVLVSNQAEGALLQALQQDLWGQFDWFALEAGPAVWRYRVRRSNLQSVPRNLREFMGFDHRRCDELFAALEAVIQERNLDGARSAHGQFELGMLSHFAMEEKEFFPAFEERTGMRQGPTMVMRMEHEQMRGLLKQMRQTMEKGDLGGLQKAGNTMMMVIQQHNVKEEQMLYPMGDMHLGQGVNELLKKMQQLQTS